MAFNPLSVLVAIFQQNLNDDLEDSNIQSRDTNCIRFHNLEAQKVKTLAFACLTSQNQVYALLGRVLLKLITNLHI